MPIDFRPAPLAALILLAFVFAPAVTQAQSGPDTSFSDTPSPGAGLRFVGVSSGAGLMSAFEGTSALSVKVDVARRRYAFSARLLHVTEFTIFGPPPRSLTEIGAMAGWRLESPGGWFLTRLQAGASLLIDTQQRRVRNTCTGWCIFDDPDDYEQSYVPTPGLPAEFEMIFTPFRHVGIGLSLTGNLNAVEPFAGALFTLHVGRLR